MPIMSDVAVKAKNKQADVLKLGLGSQPKQHWKDS